MLYTEILKDKKIFLRLYKKGRFCTCREVAAYYLPNRLNMNRFGITAGKKLGNAVTRNRAKGSSEALTGLAKTFFPQDTI